MQNISSIGFVALLASISLLLTACGSSVQTDTLSDSSATATAATSGTTDPTTAPAAVASLAPVLKGSPAPAVAVGEAYSFEPTSSDPNGDALTFSASNVPSWTHFDSTTGALTGTPTAADVSTYANIVISASNGNRSTSLPPFTIAVTQISTGSATLSWVPPTENTDGSVLTNLSGYEIYYGKNSHNLSSVVKVTNASISRYFVSNLSAGTWYFAVSALNSKGVRSNLSGVSSKVIG